MQYTTNYSLKKPQYADEADIEKINENTEAIDNLIHQNRTMIAPAFDNTKAYVTGDPVEYLGALYVFVADKAAGAWDASKVEPTTAAEMGGGGASALADLDDVEIASPAQGQALLFDDDDDVWKNQTLPDPSVTKTATGNPIEITDAADAPMVKCVTAITGYQSGTGTPSPDNVRPITAYTENTISVGHDMGIPIESGTINSNGTKATSTIRCRTGEFINLVANKNYKVIVTTTQSKTINVVYQFWTTNTFGSNSTTYDSGWLTVPFVFSPTVNKYCTMSIRYDDNSNISPDDLTVKIIEVEQESTTTYPNAIYRGSEDVVKGEVSAEKLVYTISDDTGVQGLTALTNVTRVIIDINATQLKSSGTHISNYLDYFLNYTLDEPHFYFDSNNRVVAFFPGVMTGDQWRAYIANNPLQIAYEIEPTTTAVTPTNLPIKSLSGYNHIESSTGDMEIEYITKTYEPLVELIEASDHIYSTQEQVVGTWIDGKTLYEQTLYLASASISSGTSASMPSISGVETVMVVGGSCYDVNDQRYYPLPYIRFNDTESIKIQAHVVSGSLATLVFTNFSTAYSLKDISVVIRYTKSSSNRSLSAPVTSQKSISEPLTDKTEEVPTEEENAVEEKTEEENEAER